MKNRIDACFEDLKARGRKALVTFVTAGDPDLATTEKLVTEMFDEGADLVEIGVPFSDPIAEGGTIQRASLRALKNKTNLDQIFSMVSRLRDVTDKPILLMMYMNTVFRYGTEKFFNNCQKVQIDGVIIPDMPFEERDEVKEYAEKTGVHSIYLVAPTSKERVKMIAEESKGFLYIVSSLGVTGTRKEINTDFNELLAPLKEGNYCPACIGFGISDGEQAKKMAAFSDGCIIGSAIVNIVEKYGADSVEPVGEFVKSVRDALDG
ncbi:tryptophan synthase subunit alpha [Ruminococcus sp.]|uniref:tryptophan synthase subunit alpha n=1 Tax=Ruminococcus sp. TaxID=41978 RepID=UPI0025DE5C78|nr:tryptophan synthase subunit alpha [Ruminococcus sp.]MBQ8967510.1 tryptophan synthase subunit alpha [Ruminococcus sp.]